MTKYKLSQISENPALMDKITDSQIYWEKFNEALDGGLEEVELEGLEYEAEEVEVGGDVEKKEEVVQDISEEERGTEEREGEEETSQKQEEQEMVGEGQPDGEVETKQSEADKEVEEEVKKLRVKYKFYGKEYERDLTEDDIRTAYQMSLKFPELEKEIQALKPRAEILDKYGMTEEQLEFAKKLFDGDQTAITQLLKTADIDPYLLETDKAESVKFEKTAEPTFPKEVIEKISYLKETDPDGMKVIGDMSERIFPSCLVEAINKYPEAIQLVYDSYNNRGSGGENELETTLLKVYERTLHDDVLRRQVDRNFETFIKIYGEEAQKLGFVPTGGDSQGQTANPTGQSDKTVNKPVSTDKLRASAVVRGATTGGTRKKEFKDMSPAEQVEYLDSLDFNSKEFQELLKKYRGNVYGT